MSCDSPDTRDTPRSLPRLFLARLVSLQPGEASALGWSFAYFFCLIAGYYILRPLRDEMGIAGGVRNLPWLFTATLLVMLAVVPVFGALVARLPRRRFIPLVYHFFVANIMIFWLLLTFDVGKVYVARVFFVWISVFNLFAVSVFWSFMADSYTAEQGKRLFGFIAAGGSAGGLLGPSVAVGLSAPLGPANLLPIAALLLEAAVFCALRLEIVAAHTRAGAEPSSAGKSTRPVAPGGDQGLGGGWLAGIALLLRSRYLAGIATWVALLSLAGTFLYFMQANIVAAASDDPAVRTRIFATIDLAVGVLTILIQVCATGRLIRRFGTGPAAAVLPLVFAAGFLALWLSPALWVVIGFQAVQRTANFAVSNPAREALFTVLAREEKYKAKNVIDLVVFRGLDALSGWGFAALRSLGLELGLIALVTVPVAVGWLGLALLLGRAHERKSAAPTSPAAK
jgi:ATP:ADP antiporter, AAA family